MAKIDEIIGDKIQDVVKQVLEIDGTECIHNKRHVATRLMVDMVNEIDTLRQENYENKICKNCKFYNEYSWHPELNHGERTTQHAGRCQALYEFLSKDNLNLIYSNIKDFYVFENFHCGFWIKKER